MKWIILDTGVASPKENMALDVQLLENLDPNGSPILHFYDWIGDSATYGYFTDPTKFLNIPSKIPLEIAKRPTGGGIIFHTCDLAFSALVPSEHPSFSINTLENYAFINGLVMRAVRNFIDSKIALPELLNIEPTPLDKCSKYFCMAKPTQYDVIINGKKVGGGAQRRTKNGYLHQGTISLAMPPQSFLEKVLIKGTRVLEAMQQNTFQLIDFPFTTKQLNVARKEIKNLLTLAVEMHVPQKT